MRTYAGACNEDLLTSVDEEFEVFEPVFEKRSWRADTEDTCAEGDDCYYGDAEAEE